MAAELLHIGHVNSTTVDQVLIILGMVVATAALGWASVWMLKSGSNSGEAKPGRMRRRERLALDEEVGGAWEPDTAGEDGADRVVVQA